jgi:hypothetical protein
LPNAPLLTYYHDRQSLSHACEPLIHDERGHGGHGGVARKELHQRWQGDREAIEKPRQCMMSSSRESEDSEPWLLQQFVTKNVIHSTMIEKASITVGAVYLSGRRGQVIRKNLIC